VQVQVNGETREVAEHTTLTSLITDLQFPAQRIAVELNRAVVRRSEWSTTELKEGDRIEVVHFVGGGARHFSSEAH
jgi:thiamine biosynthesis protein ThiS